MQERINVLVGEDDPNDRLILQRTFRKVWPEVHVELLPSGLAVLDHLKAESSPVPSLIILDTLTARMTGWAVLEWLQAHPTLAKVPVVMLTGQATEKDKLRAEALGAKAYLEKPQEVSELQLLLKSLDQFWQPAG